MIITRNATTYSALQKNLSKDSTALNQLYIESSTGLKVSKASDDPSAVASIISCRSTIVQNDRYVENCKQVQDNLSNSEVSIDSVNDILTRAQEIAINGVNGTLSDADKATLADEVSQMRSALLDLANTQIDGKYIFAGYNDQTKPFTGDPVVYNGTDDSQLLEISPGTTVAKNITGKDLFMEPTNLFTTLENLQNALTSGDATTISNQLADINAASEQVSSQLSFLGNTSSRMDDIISMHENATLTVKSTLSDKQDADLAEVLSEVNKMETALQATMQVTARVSKLSLMNYL